MYQSLLIFCCILLLSACDMADVPSDSLEPLTPSIVASTRVTITFATERVNFSRYQPLVAQFNRARDDVQVVLVDAAPIVAQVRGAEPAEFLRQMAAGIASSADASDMGASAPDLAATYTYNLKPLIDADPAFDPDDLYPFVREQLEQANAIYGLPRYVEVAPVSYNSELLRSAGVALPPEVSWGELAEIAGKLVQREDDQITRYGLIDDGLGSLVMLDELARVRPDVTADAVEPDQLIPVVTAYRALIESGALYRVPTDADGNLIVDVDALKQLVIGEKVAFWPAALVPDPAMVAFPIATLPMPAVGYPLLLSGNLSISAASQHPQAAWEWISFLSRQHVPPLGTAIAIQYELPTRRSLFAAATVSVPPAVLPAIVQTLERPPTAPRGASGLAGPLVFSPSLLSDAPASAVIDEVQAMMQPADQSTATSNPLPTVAAVATLPPADAAVARFISTIPDAIPYAAIATRLDTGADAPRVRATVASSQYAFTDLAALGEQADCFTLVEPPAAAEMRALTDLRPLLDADARGLLSDLPAVVRQPLERDGRLYGLPLTVGVPTLNGNAALLDAVSVSLPDAGATPQDILALAQLLTRGDGPDRQYGYAAAGSLTADLDWWLRRSGISLVDATGQPSFTNPATLAAIDSFLTLLRDTSPHTRLSGASDDLLTTAGADAIAAGRVALWLGLPTSAPVAPADGAVVRGIAPTGTAGLTSADLDVRGGYVSAQTDALQGCWAMLTALSENTTGLSSAPGGPLLLPARTSIATDAAFTSSLGDDGATLAAAATVALTRATSQPPADADLPRRWFYRAVDAALQGENLERELADAQARTGAYLACVATGTALETCLADE